MVPIKPTQAPSPTPADSNPEPIRHHLCRHERKSPGKQENLKPLDLPTVELAIQRLILERLDRRRKIGNRVRIRRTEVLPASRVRNPHERLLVQP